MKNIPLVSALTLALGMALASGTQAQAPAGSTGECKDGSYTSAESKRGACAGHGGVKTWYADKKSEAKTEKKAETKSTDKKPATATAAPAGAMPAGSTGECKDGTYSQAESKRGACRGHGGVKEWYAESKSTEKKSTAAAPAAAPAPAPAPAPAAAAPKESMKTASKKAPEGMRAEAAPGGGAGKVWVNTSSKVYHCSGDEWYGKTKEGEYMTEAQAKASGARAARNKTCS